jgi:hypothetical protein
VARLGPVEVLEAWLQEHPVRNDLSPHLCERRNHNLHFLGGEVCGGLGAADDLGGADAFAEDAVDVVAELRVVDEVFLVLDLVLGY